MGGDRLSIGERIKEVRKQSGLTQQKFADKIGLKRNTVGSYEINLIEPSDRTISDICREFNVNETWIRTGEGEMFIPTKRDDEIAEFVGRIMAGEEDNFKRRFVAMLSRLDESEWEFIERKALELFEESKKD